MGWVEGEGVWGRINSEVASAVSEGCRIKPAGRQACIARSGAGFYAKAAWPSAHGVGGLCAGCGRDAGRRNGDRSQQVLDGFVAQWMGSKRLGATFCLPPHLTIISFCRVGWGWFVCGRRDARRSAEYEVAGARVSSRAGRIGGVGLAVTRWGRAGGCCWVKNGHF